MRGTILQPGYFPWLGFFNQMACSDVFVYLDDVQFDRRGWRNRNRIKGPDGPIWLTVPVVQRGKFEQLLTETRIDNSQKWAFKHLKTIEFNYRTAPCFQDYFPELQQIITTSTEYLVDLDIALIEAHLRWLGLTGVRTMRASSLPVKNMDKTGRLVEICRLSGITDYISGPLCRNYLELNQFSESGIQVYLHDYHHPVYRQLHGEFVPFMGTIDLIMNEGPNSTGILKNPEALIEFSKYKSRNGVPDLLE
ncbi:WbqC family protein [bacterium]|nr:WbqC family protein [candidate division CSSED10-310 bacterium]